jgi:hypothetical protein
MILDVEIFRLLRDKGILKDYRGYSDKLVQQSSACFRLIEWLENYEVRPLRLSSGKYAIRHIKCDSPVFNEELLTHNHDVSSFKKLIMLILAHEINCEAGE